MNRYRILLAMTSLALFAASAVAGTAPEDDQAKACRGDALRLCLVDIPHKDKITDCMKRHISELSPRCRAMFPPEERPPPPSNPNESEVVLARHGDHASPRSPQNH